MSVKWSPADPVATGSRSERKPVGFRPAVHASAVRRVRRSGNHAGCRIVPLGFSRCAPTSGEFRIKRERPDI
jgi:hypothetical protein